MARARRQDHVALRQVARDRKGTARIEDHEDCAATETEAGELHGSKQLQVNIPPLDTGKGTGVAGGRENSVLGGGIRSAA